MKHLYELYLQASGITTDTRKIDKGNLFFALKGPNFNGNKFADQALAAGASHVIVDEGGFVKDDRYILVDNVLSTLQKLAKHHRKQLNIPIIGITGSNGKTTTKELIQSVLSQQYQTFATFGNLNNHIGVPLSLLSITKEHEIAIIEMGANHIGEIASYCKWALPNIGLITNIGSAHLEGFGSKEGIIKGKTELYRSIEASKGLAFYNKDSEILSNKVAMISKRVSYGFTRQADYQFKLRKETPSIEIERNGENFSSPLFGAYNAINIIAAITLGFHFELTVGQIKKGIADYIPSNNRSQIVEQGNTRYILDAYNANPTSMEAALTSFSAMDSDIKVAILGDMFELGPTEVQEHKNIRDIALSLGIDTLVFVGKRFKVWEDKAALYFETTDEAKTWFASFDTKDKSILLKGSRSMRLESLIS